MIVLDASAALELILRTARSPGIAARLSDPGETLHAPDVIDLEVVQVLRRFLRAKRLSEKRATEALADFRDLPVVRYVHDVLLDRIWELRHDASACDAAYVALAEALDAPLLTADERLCGLPDLRVRIEVA